MSDPFFDFAWRRAANGSKTNVRASEEEPILVFGFQYTIINEGVAEIWFCITNVFDLRALPDFEKGTAPTGEDDPDLLVPYSSGGGTDFKLGSKSCGG